MTQASYNERIERLRSYAASLEADCDENARYTAEAEKKVQENENLAREQMSEADRNRRIIGEIDSMFEDKEEEKQVTALRVI